MAKSGTPSIHAKGQVVVCGSGLSGLVSAVSAQEAGAQVTLIEKAPRIGGSTAISGGVLWTFADYDLLRKNVPHGDPILQWLVCTGIDSASQWLWAQGVRGGPEEPFFNIGRGWHIEPVQALEALAAKFIAMGGTLLQSWALESIDMDEGRLTGIHCVTPNGNRHLATDALILATGGFQGNQELLARYIVRDPTHLALRASPWSTGDGLIAATLIGAACSPGLDKFYGHALCVLPPSEDPVDFRALSQFYGPASVALNLEGRRFADESDGAAEEVLNYRLSQQTEGRGWYIVDDHLMAQRPMPGLDLVTSAIIARARSAGAEVVSASSIDALSTGLAEHGLPASVVRAELMHFNAAMSDGLADNLTPPRRGNRRALSMPPYHAVQVKASITFTMGGLQIDEHARVRRRSGSSAIGRAVPAARAVAELGELAVEIDDYRETVIPGLYAAGCDVGNIHHRGYAGGLAAGLVVGRVAGQQAATFVNRPRG